MELLLKRRHAVGKATIGELYVDGEIQCFTLENQHHDQKVDGETRIWAGTYDIEFREVLSPMTGKYRDRHSDAGFTWHLELQGVPGFKYIYIHIGNTVNHTDGCILVGDSANINGSIGQSTDAFIELYAMIAEALRSGEKVIITIEDE